MLWKRGCAASAPDRRNYREPFYLLLKADGSDEFVPDLNSAPLPQRDSKNRWEFNLETGEFFFRLGNDLTMYDVHALSADSLEGMANGYYAGSAEGCYTVKFVRAQE